VHKYLATESILGYSNVIPYSLIANDSNTFVLRMPLSDFKALMPDVTSIALTRECKRREKTIVTMLNQHVNGIPDLKMKEDREKLVMKTHVKSNFPFSNRGS